MFWSGYSMVLSGFSKHRAGPSNVLLETRRIHMFECDTSTVLSWEAPHRLPVVAPGPVGNQEQETVEPCCVAP